MEEATATNTTNSVGVKSDPDTIMNKFYSVQFSLNSGPVYLFKLRDISLNGLCILVKGDSSVLKQLEVGDILNMEYNPPESFNSSKSLKTRITSKNSHDHFAGHTLVGLSIVEKQGSGLRLLKD